MASRETYAQAYREFMTAAGEIGLPEEVSRIIARNLSSPIGLRRMASYLRNAHPRSMEEIADEMVALMEDREAWIRKKQAEESSNRYNEWLNSDMREPED